MPVTSGDLAIVDRLALAPLFVAADVTAAGWEEIGTNSARGGGVSNNDGQSQSPGLALDTLDNPVVVWQDRPFNGDAEIYLKAWTGSGWQALGGSDSAGGLSDNGGDSLNPSLVLDGDDLPIVAWEDRTIGNAEIYIKRWDGMTWAPIGTGSGSGGGLSSNMGESRNPSLTLDGDHAVVAWEDMTSGNAEIYLKRWGEDSWEQLADSATDGGISANSAASETPVVAV
ncbi:MAG: hypothetical protein FJ279_38175, partial [Planctomycetes bacterium]|nr:hypothetical protein [Planctomycetota bacterium]